MSDKSKQKRDLRKRRHAASGASRCRVTGSAASGGVPLQPPHRGAGHRRPRGQHPGGRQLAGIGAALFGPRDVPRPRKVGALVAERASSAGIDTVVFDRGGIRYHGRVAALAEAAREAGLEF